MSEPGWATVRDPSRAERPLAVLGAMNFGKRTPEREALAIVARAFERGVRLVDTANAYGEGESERIVGRALAARPELAVATKVGFGRVSGKPEGLSPARIRAAFDASRARLGRERVDLYYLHVPDHATPIADSLGAMAELVGEGRVGHVGVSNYAAWQVLEMFGLCEQRGWPKPRVAQQLYNLLIRQLDVEFLPFAARYGLHTTVYNPLAGGLLTPRHLAAAPGDGAPEKPAAGSRFDGNKLYLGRYWSATMFELARRYADLAREAGLDLVSLAYRWLAAQPGVSSVLVGPGSVAQLDAALDALEQPLAPELCAAIDAIHVAHLGTETRYVR